MTEGTPVYRAMEGLTPAHLDLVEQELRARDVPSLIQDILLIAHNVRARAVAGGTLVLEPGEAAADAASRVLAAQGAPGGLTAALLRQVAGKLESRMVTAIRDETERLVGGGQ